jgi:transcriptional regulator GlxA family with amidase domain
MIEYLTEFPAHLTGSKLWAMSFIQLAHNSGHRTSVHQTCAVHAVERASRRVPRQQLVTRATAFLRDNIGDPITVTELSRMVGVSERTLRAAFHHVLGLSPKQYAINERLRAARAALSAADPGTTTVTDIAMTYGFFELGRFAGRYRDVYGEVPSRTLRHVTASWPEQAA